MPGKTLTHQARRMTLRPEPYARLVNERTFRALEALEAEARARGVAMDALALACVLHHPQMDAAIIGPRRPEHVDAALGALSIVLSAEELGRLRGLFAI